LGLVAEGGYRLGIWRLSLGVGMSYVEGYHRMEYDLIDHDAMKNVFCSDFNIIGFFSFYWPLWVRGYGQLGAVVDLESGV
jgi:hypothetical protein